MPPRHFAQEKIYHYAQEEAYHHALEEIHYRFQAEIHVRTRIGGMVALDRRRRRQTYEEQAMHLQERPHHDHQVTKWATRSPRVPLSIAGGRPDRRVERRLRRRTSSNGPYARVGDDDASDSGEKYNRRRYCGQPRRLW